jgi:hypothetical protein
LEDAGSAFRVLAKAKSFVVAKPMIPLVDKRLVALLEKRETRGQFDEVQGDSVAPRLPGPHSRAYIVDDSVVSIAKLSLRRSASASRRSTSRPDSSDARRGLLRLAPRRRSRMRCPDTTPATIPAQRWSSLHHWHQLSRWLQAPEDLLIASSAQRIGVQLRAPEGALCATDKPVCCNALLGSPSQRVQAIPSVWSGG